MLTFGIGGAEYAIDILCVQEIRRFEVPTRITNSSTYVLGALNLRGTIAPVFDLRKMLGFDIAVYDETTPLIVLNRQRRVAIVVVDSVSDVIDIEPDQVRPPLAVGQVGLDSLHLTGVILLDGDDGYSERLLQLMDLQALLREELRTEADLAELG